MSCNSELASVIDQEFQMKWVIKLNVIFDKFVYSKVIKLFKTINYPKGLENNLFFEKKMK